ncbi:MAG: RDD family protein [Halioglobus sp.]|nr:RDD family protein [Halioglobus sp.]
MKHLEQPASPSLPRRLAAMLYDVLLVVALVAVVNGLALGALVQLTNGKQQVLNANLVQLLTLLSVFGFYSIFWLKSGQTLGMQAWRIKLVDFHGGRPKAGKALLRCLGACLSAACLGLGYLWCIVDRNNRYWHDYLSGTELILLAKEEKKEPESTD